ncbi:MAG: N-acetylglucosamine-6-phosphate deacetylase [Steroidobacteraceae bacterium]
MNEQTIAGNVLSAAGWRHGTIGIQRNRISFVPQTPADPGTNDDVLIIPGFIDLHVHGGGGADVMDSGEPFEALARMHARHGTTALLTTTMTAPREEIEAVLAKLGRYIPQPRAPSSARVLGVHLEGPYINRGRLGSQPDFAIAASIEQLESHCSLAPLKVVTLAPEIPGHLELVRLLTAKGIRVQIGHTLATYEQGLEALASGACGFTHLFNAMTPLNHRAPGIVGAALAHASYCELIPDLVHVHPGALRAALRAIPKAYCVSDSTAGAGMPDGEYRLGRQRVTKTLGCVRLADGTLAGSTLTLDQGLRNLVALGLSIEDASARVSRYPADYLGLQDRGRIEAGAWADLVVLDRALRPIAVYVEGESVDLISS